MSVDVSWYELEAAAAEALGVDEAAIVDDGQRVLDRMGVPDAELSVVVCTDTFIQPLNLEYRGLDKPTDVLSFSQREGEEADPDDPMLGDVIISLDTAIRQAAERGHSLALEVRVLLVHGIFHLLGYDHEVDAEAEEMEALEREVLAELSGT
jgi:probable rRNA maturation factor